MTDIEEIQRKWRSKENGDPKKMEIQRKWRSKENGDPKKMEIQRKWKYECYKFGDVSVDIVG